MNDILASLVNAFRASGYQVDETEPRVRRLAEKLLLLHQTGHYARLLGDLFAANDQANIQSLILEATFAFHFEVEGKPLAYEVKQRTDNDTTIDFCRAMPSEKKLFMEMRLVRQRQAMAEDIASQLAANGTYAVFMGGDQDRDETRRLQGLVLSKAQDKDGRPIKFDADVKQGYNVIAVEVSALHLGAIDLADCLLVTNGDPAVDEPARRRMFGLFQEADAAYPEDILKLAEAFKTFRATIHAVLFLWKRPVDPADYELEAALICNRALMSEADAIAVKDEIYGVLAMHKVPKAANVA